MVAELEEKPYAGITGAVCAMLGETGLSTGAGSGFDDTRFAGHIGQYGGTAPPSWTPEIC